MPVKFKIWDGQFSFTVIINGVPGAVGFPVSLILWIELPGTLLFVPDIFLLLLTLLLRVSAAGKLI